MTPRTKNSELADYSAKQIVSEGGLSGGPTSIIARIRTSLFIPGATINFILLFLLIRFVTSIAALIPSAFPSGKRLKLSPIELTVGVWPPSRPMTLWLERVFAAPWERWDTKYYISALENGFRTSDGSASFHPLFVWLSVPFNDLLHSPVCSLLIVASLSTLILYPAFFKLASLDFSDREAKRATFLFILFPLSYVFYAPYTESTFLVFAVVTLLFARQRRWILAGLFGALATLTRQQGLFLVFAIGWEMWECRKWRPSFGAIFLIPLAYVFWIIYRTFALSDATPDFSSVQGMIYSVLVSSSSRQVIQEQAFLLPPYAMYLGVKKLWLDPNLAVGIDLFFAVVFIALLFAAWQKLRMSYKLYCTVILVVSFSFSTGMMYSSTYLGLPRHLLLAFPLFIGVAPKLNEKTATLLYEVGLFGIFALALFHCRGVWVP